MAKGVDRKTYPAGVLHPALQAFVEARLGMVQAARDVSWDHGESTVWALSTREGPAVLKVHRQGRKFRNELAAYTSWLPRFTSLLEPGSHVPDLLAVHGEHPRALLLELVAGEVMDDLKLDSALETEVHERAGRFLRHLHELDVNDVDAMPLAEAYALRLEAWVLRADGVVPATVTTAVLGALAGALPFMAGQVRVPCHRDFTPRNWLVRSGDRSTAGADAGPGERVLTVIDFEHSQPDLYLTDLLRLWVGVWRHRPDLRSSFLKGYGRPLMGAEEEALRGLAAFWAYSTVVWAREHGDGDFERTGWQTLNWLGLE